MTIQLQRAAIQKLHQEKATLIRTAPVEWPEAPIDTDAYPLPLVLVRRGELTMYREGSIQVQTQFWHPTVYLVEENQKTLALAENRAIAITQQLGELYLNRDNETLVLGGEPCRFATIFQGRRDQGSIGASELMIQEYWGKKYYVVEFTFMTTEKHQ